MSQVSRSRRGEDLHTARPAPSATRSNVYNVEPSKVDARVAYTANAGRWEGDIE